MSLTAPYNNAMRIGQGFNTYTQEIRMQNAVIVTLKPHDEDPETSPQILPTQQKATAPLHNPTTTNTQQAAPVTNGVTTLANQIELPMKGVDLGALLTGSETDDIPKLPQKLKPQLRPKTITPGVITQLSDQNAADPSSVFVLPDTPLSKSSQTVTYSIRAIDNVSDIMDAFNISTAMSIKYGTIYGNASAAFVNESKVLDSELNYVVSVKVNNDTHICPEEMKFQPIENLPVGKFTEVYGDSFISGFLEGGEFNAVISIKLHDKSKQHRVEQAIDVALAVGPSPVSIGGAESFEKEHAELFQDTEITISVNCSGGGDIKKPEVPWTLSTVMAVANAFPSMVARRSSKTSAILTRCSSLNDFQAWRWKMAKENEKYSDINNLILNYAPCSIYTADLFDALMAYKVLWKRCDTIMQDMRKWKMRDPPKKLAISPGGGQSIANGTPVSQKWTPPVPDKSSASPTDGKANGTTAKRAQTFAVDDPMVEKDWDLIRNNNNRDPIPLDSVALNEARLLCREAMTLITEEAARLVDHPNLAYADFDAVSKKTRMKRPNYAYPEVLKERLPVRIRNDAADDAFVFDAAAEKTRRYARDDELYMHMEGDIANPHRKYRPFTSLDLNGGKHEVNPLIGLSVHGYHYHRNPLAGHFSKDSHLAIEALGFHFAADDVSKKQLDDCTSHCFRPHFDDPSMFRKVRLSGSTAFRPGERGHSEGKQISRIDICYVPGSGRIAGLVFYDKFGDARAEVMAWRQWGAAGHEPQGLKIVPQYPPQDDGQEWTFVGLAGDFDTTIWGDVLSRVSRIWKRT